MARSVCLTDKRDKTRVIQGWHHMFYTDTNNEPYAIMEDLDGLIRCLNLDYWEYRFDDPPQGE